MNSARTTIDNLLHDGLIDRVLHFRVPDGFQVVIYGRSLRQPSTIGIGPSIEAAHYAALTQWRSKNG